MKNSMILIMYIFLFIAAFSCETIAQGTFKPQPTLDTRTVEVLFHEGLQFKDLNRNGRLDNYEDWRLPAEQRAEDLLSKMTLEEKAGLMHITSERRRGFMPGGGPGDPAGNANVNESASSPLPEDPFPATVDYINNRNIRYLILRDNLSAFENATRNNKYQEIAENTRLGIPIVFTSNPRNHVGRIEFGITEASGQFSLWPGQLGLAAARDATMIQQFAEIARREWRASGIRKIYGYQVDVATEPRWRRISGTFGENPYLSAEYTWELVRGFQGPELNSESVALTIKHFPGDGAVHLGLDPHGEAGQWAVYPTEGSLYKYQLPPFQAAFDAGVSSLMSYYNRPNNALSQPQLHGEPFEEVAGAYNRAIITDLPNEMGFAGYVNTDSGILTNTAWGVDGLSAEQRYAKAIKAGVAIFSDYNDPTGLISAVEMGLLSEEELNPAVKSLLCEIFTLGLFESPYVDPQEAQEIANNPESQAIADNAHRKSIVLLRNAGILPLNNDQRAYIEVFNGNNSDATTNSFKELVGETVQIVNSPSEADVALVWVMPRTYEISAEEGVSISLNDDTGIDVEKIISIESTVPTVLVINMDNPWIINEIEPGAAAVLTTFSIKGEALLDVVYGRFNPTGKLPLSFPADLEAVENNASDVPGYAEDFDYVYTNEVGDKYIYGFGLSYQNNMSSR